MCAALASCAVGFSSGRGAPVSTVAAWAMLARNKRIHDKLRFIRAPECCIAGWCRGGKGAPLRGVRLRLGPDFTDYVVGKCGFSKGLDNTLGHLNDGGTKHPVAKADR